MQASFNENTTTIFYAFCLIFLSFSSQMFFRLMWCWNRKRSWVIFKFVKWILMKILHVKN